MSIGRVPGATGIQPSIVDAKGDIIAATAADSVSRLAVGTNNQVLTADSAEATGLKYANEARATLTTTGDILYASAANTPARLGIGTAGQVLTVNSGATAPEWGAAPTAGANWSLLNTGGTALTGAATVTVTGISGKDKIMVLVGGASSSSAGELIYVRFNTDTASNYYNFGHTHDWPTTYSTNDIYIASGAASAINLGATSTNAGSAVSGYVLLSGCNSSGVKVYEYSGSGNANGGNYQTSSHIGGYYNSSSTISSVSVTASGGNLDAGTVYIYTSA